MNLKGRTAASLIKELSKSKEIAGQLVIAITVNVTEMFRNPEFFKALQQDVFPDFFELAQLKVWHAGCSSGEEVYSLAILLKEHHLLENSQLLGWDLNPEMVAKASKGILSDRQLNAYLDAYFLAGGKTHLQDYFQSKSGVSTLNQEILSHCQFQTGNIQNFHTKEPLDMILCRNTLIYFDLSLQDEIVNVFYNSLKKGGFLCLGEKESIRFTSKAHLFEEVSSTQKIFRKISYESGD